MISRRNFILALPSLLFLNAHAQIRKQRAIRIVYHPDIAPYSFNEKPLQKPQGILVDLIDSLAPTLDLPLSSSAYPWKRAQIMVKNGLLDAFCCPETPERQHYALFAPTPIITLQGQVVFFNPNSPHAAAIQQAKTIEDFYPFRTATFFGNSSHDIIWKDHPHVAKVSKVKQILLMLARERIDFYFADPLVTAYKIKQLALTNKLSSAPLGYIIHQEQSTEMRFGLRRSFPNAEKIVTQVDENIKKIITPKLRQQITNSYL